MKRLLAVIICLLIGIAIISPALKMRGHGDNLYPIPGVTVQVNPVAEYEGEEDEDLTNVMVPIPMEDRVFNRTGIQCVWCSLETCGRYAEESKLINLTDLADCKSYSSPGNVAFKMKQLKVKYEQTTSKMDRSLIIKSVVNERRGCLFAIPGHAMTLVHYDEQKGIVKYINNSDRTLKIRTWTMEEFNRRWDGWVCVVYADNDIVPQKYVTTTEIPIVDRNGSQGIYSKDYVLLPKK